MAAHKDELADLFSAAVADDAGRASLARMVFPDRKRAALALADEAALAKLDAAYSRMRPADEDDAAWAGVLNVPKDRVDVRVHGSSGAQLAAADPMDPTLREFPGGAVQIGSLLRPEVTFFEVECLAPGATAGTRFHLFFWDGHAWCMLGPIWRMLR